MGRYHQILISPSLGFSCGLTLPCALRKCVLSTHSHLHYRAETPLCPSQPLASPFP